MRTRYDQFGKHLVRAAVKDRGAVETDAEAHAEPRRVDFWFNPRPDSARPSLDLGLLGQVTENACTLEFFHDTPSGASLAECIIRHGMFRHILGLRKDPPPVPRQWVISSGRPEQGIDGLRFQPREDWLSGIYEGPPLLWTWLVVVSELPVTRPTLLLRLLGAGRVLRQAIAELKMLPDDAPERSLALPILLRLRLEVPAYPAARSDDDQEFLMDTQDIVEKWRHEAIEEGVGLGLSRALVRLCEARFGALASELRRLIEETHDERTLEGWIALAGTSTFDDVAAAMRASRAR